MNNTCYAYRALYEKKGLIRFVSHLDVARMVMRALRLGVDELNFSRGFNPHPKVSFCQALSLGFESDSEYFDFESLDRLDMGLLPGKINKNLPGGLKIVRVNGLERENSVGEPVSCSYVVELEKSPEYIAECLNKFNSSETWVFRKENGREINLRETMEEIKLFCKKDNRAELFLKISLENKRYVNPRIIICELFNYTEKDVLKLVFCRKHFDWRRRDAENTNKC